MHADHGFSLTWSLVSDWNKQVLCGHCQAMNWGGGMSGREPKGYRVYVTGTVSDIILLLLLLLACL